VIRQFRSYIIRRSGRSTLLWYTLFSTVPWCPAIFFAVTKFMNLVETESACTPPTHQAAALRGWKAFQAKWLA